MYLEQLLTIVIPCKNEGVTIKKTLSLLNQQYQIKGVDVIVADSSDDQGFTKSVIESEMNKSINLIRVGGGLPAVARNIGASYASTKFILFMDADIFIEDHYLLHSIVTKANFEKAHLSTCKIRTKDFYSVVFTVFDFIRSFIIKKTPFAVGGFMLFDRNEFYEVGQFDEEDLIAEDYHISKKTDPSKFRIYDYTAFTSSRRFRNKGILYMINIMIRCWLNRNDDSFYKKDFKYFA